jgi:transketolase
MIAGIPDEDVPNGSDSEVFQFLGLDAAGICEKAKELIKRK